MKKFYSEITDEFLNDFNALVNESDRILITSHFSPDDDSISSVMSLFIHLTENLKLQNVDILYTGSKSDRWDYFPSYKNIQFVEDIADYISEYDLAIFVDGNKWSRFSHKNIPEDFPNSVCIDHHSTQNSDFDLHLSIKDSPATALLIYKLFFNNIKNLTKEICEVILLGIIGDTGGFKYIDNKQTETFIISERLIREGEINVNEFQTFYNLISPKIFSAYQRLIENCSIQKVADWPNCMVTFLSKRYVDENMLTSNEIKEASNLMTEQLLLVENVKWGFVVTPRENISSISFRAQPNSVNVRLIAEQMNGGGHDQTAGAKFDSDDVELVVDKIKKWLEENEPTYE